jgi:hypothetical protein
MERNVMKKMLLSVVSGSALVLVMGLAAGCGGGGGSSSSPGNGGGGNGDVVEGISTPSSVSVVTAQNADQVQ